MTEQERSEVLGAIMDAASASREPLPDRETLEQAIASIDNFCDAAQAQILSVIPAEIPEPLARKLIRAVIVKRGEL